MLITFTTEEARAAHPEAGLISQDDWQRYFDGFIEADLLSMMRQPSVAQGIASMNLSTPVNTQGRRRVYIQEIVVCLRARFPETNPDDIFRMIVETRGYTGADCFIGFCGAGVQVSQALLEEIIRIININAGFAGLTTVLSACLQEACRYGQTAIAQCVYNLAPTADQRVAMLQARAAYGDCDYAAFQDACARGHLETARWLYEVATAELRAQMLQATGYSGKLEYATFVLACSQGHLEIARWLFEVATAEQQAAMLQARHREFVSIIDYASFQRACAAGHFQTARWLYEVATAEQQAAMLQANGYAAFQSACAIGHLETARWLLSLSPRVFAYADSHDREYGQRVVYSFVGNFVETLHQRQEAHQIAHPDSVFDIEDEQETLFAFFCLRNLIRRNDPALMEHINYLLMLPRLRSILHLGVNGGEENECLRLALRMGNRGAAAALMRIETVLTRALAQNYYAEEQRVHGGLSLAEIARNRESSMRALNGAEKASIERIEAHYAAALEAEGGVNGVFEAFKRYLSEQYHAAPAYLIVEDTQIPLPFEYADFQVYLESNRLTPEQRVSAYQAYYQHPVHTAYRYLSKPNHWMHHNAAYVYINQANTQLWSTFEEYVPTIAYFWMAAKDAQMPAIDGYTLEGRMALFIKELALIGRAHNWHNARAVMNALGEPTGQSEYYDDLEGDRPSCFSGVNRRLFQSVLGHGLFMGLTRELLELELVHFVQDKVRDILAAQLGELAHNAQELHKELTAFCEVGLIEGETPSALLLSFNLSEEEISDFKVCLSKKWKLNLASNLALNTLIDVTLRMTPNDALIVHFATRANLFDMLNGMTRTAVTRGTGHHGFFASADGAGPADAEGAAEMERPGDAAERSYSSSRAAR